MCKVPLIFYALQYSIGFALPANGCFHDKLCILEGVEQVPIVQIELIEGRTIDQKKTMAKEVTDAIVRSLGVTPDAVRIIMRDMKKEDFAVGGKLRSDQ
jgi:4-oxalocrotonate tautomerase